MDINYILDSFYHAAETGNLARLQNYCERRLVFHANRCVSRRVNGMTPLAIACRNGHVAVVEYLIDEQRADIELGAWTNEEELHQRQAQPLWWAVHGNHLGVVECLLRYGANINCVTPTLVTPLIEACTGGHLEIVMCLVASGADINAVQHDGQTALMVACRQNQREIAYLLIIAGADLNGRDANGETALHHCVYNLAWTLVKVLLRGRAMVDEIFSLRTPLLIIKRSKKRLSDKLKYVICLPFQTSPSVIESLERLGCMLMDLSRQRHYKLSMNRTEEEKRKVKEEEEWSPINHPQLNPRERRVDYITISRRPTVHDIRSGFSNCFFAYEAWEDIRCNYEETDMSRWTMTMLMRRVSSEPVRNMIWRCLYLFVILVNKMTVEELRAHCVIVLVAFIIAVHEVESEAQSAHQALANHILFVLLNLLLPALDMVLEMNKEQRWQLTRAIRRCVRVKLRNDNGMTLLHYACSHRQTSHRSVLTLDLIALTIRVLLKAGAETQDIDNNYRSPLHHLLMPPHQPLRLVEAGEVVDEEEYERREAAEARRVPIIDDLIRRLLELGTHFDGRDCDGQHFLDALAEDERHQHDAVGHGSLLCLAANAILQHRVPYRPHLPDRFINFIMEHRTRQQINEGL